MPDEDYLVDHLRILFIHESTPYRIAQYLEDAVPRPRHPHTSSVTKLSKGMTIERDAKWEFGSQARSTMVKWAIQLVDYFELPRQVAATAAHFLDRYLSSWSCSKSDLQLLMMSALYLAIKTHQRHPLLSVETMLRTSRGLFSRDQLLRMERHLLDALTWRLHPPLPENVLDIFLRVLVRCYPVEQHTAINDQCLYYLDTALVDGFFVGHAPSVVAMAALCQVLELYIRNDTHEGYPHPMHELMRRTHLMIPAGPCHACRDRFARIMAADETVPDALPKPGSQPVARERMPSPVSVLHPSLDHAGKEA